MAKRFFETTIWTQNQWFRKLPLKSKLFWFYILGTCDSVGVWEEDFDLASFIIGEEIFKEEIYAELEGKIKILSEKKIWIIDFCPFQYGELDEKSECKPHKSYIKLLKRHRLWKEYLYSMERIKEKEKDQDKDISKDIVMEIDKDEDQDEDQDQDMAYFQDLDENYEPEVPDEEEIPSNPEYDKLLLAADKARQSPY